MAGISFGELGSSLGGIGASAITSFFWIFSIAMIGLVFYAIAMVIRRVKTYDITCRIYSKRHSGVKTWDQPGAFIKDKNTGDVFGFKIKGVDKMQKPIPYDCLFMNDKGKNTVHLKQLSLDTFEVLYPEFEWEEELKQLPIIKENKTPEVQIPTPTEVKKEDGPTA